MGFCSCRTLTGHWGTSAHRQIAKVSSIQFLHLMILSELMETSVSHCPNQTLPTPTLDVTSYITERLKSTK